MSITKASRDDILRWPDGTTCYRWEWERGDYSYMSDDFEVITEESPEYEVVERSSSLPEGAAARAAARDAGVSLWGWSGDDHPISSAVMRTPYFEHSLDTSEAEAVEPAGLPR